MHYFIVLVIISVCVKCFNIDVPIYSTLLLLPSSFFFWGGGGGGGVILAFFVILVLMYAFLVLVLF